MNNGIREKGTEGISKENNELKNRKLKVLFLGMMTVCLLASCGWKKKEVKRELTEQEEMKQEEIKQELTEHQKAWIADIDGPLREGLASAAGVNEFLSDEERNERLDALIRRIETEYLDDYEICASIKELISDIRIAHINFTPGNGYAGHKAIYVVCGQWFADGFYVMGTLEEDKECLGSRLLAVNGIELEEVLKRYDRIYSNENEMWLKKAFERDSLSHGFYQLDLEYLGIQKEGAGEIELTLEKDGAAFKKNIKVFQLNKSHELKVASLYDQIPVLPYGDRIYRQENVPLFYYDLDKEHRAMYVQYNRCIDNTEEIPWEDTSSYPNFEEFFDDVIEVMKENEGEIDCFVLDLRNNGGGSELLLNNAYEKHYEYLKQYPIKVLIGKYVFSAGQDAVDMTLHMFDDVTLYGEETGQAIHNYTAIKKIQLENTGGCLNATQHLDYCRAIHERAGNLYAGVLPDVEVVQTYEGYVNGLDEVYLKAVEDNRAAFRTESVSIDLSAAKETYAEGAEVTPLNLKVVSIEDNGVDWAYEWYEEMNLSLPMIGDDWDWFYDEQYEYYWYIGYLEITEKETGACIYMLEYPTDQWYINGNNAYLKDGIFYGASVQNGYAEPDTCFMFAYDLVNHKLLWRSADQTYNTMNFVVKGDIILCGYGFTAEKDYLYQINRNTGEVIGRLELAGKPDLLVEQDGKLYVHTYNCNYVIEME